ncbi:MAG: hypothetical protein KC877_03395 [Candidatus Kaiserbacteria bacterium]|nr:hypothetical protein [Candidatus Kaiserbacteria bacterium]MCB9815878.1 hypothetical protein [Candidatus Nomurabacteria bacterium]
MFVALIEVLKDLWRFVFRLDVVPTPMPRPNVPDPVSVELPAPEPSLADLSYKYGKTAFVSIPELSCLARPKPGFDLQLGSFHYGDTVSVLKREPDFSLVFTPQLEGWVQSGALSEDERQVFPQLVQDHIYHATHEATVAIRRVLRDACGGGVMDLPLQSLEYALYELSRRGIVVPWPQLRPRIPGQWQQLLRGVPRVRIDVEPRTGAILEHAPEAVERGFLGYVEAVHPDDSIVLRSVGRDIDGEYIVETLMRDEWREWRPVFINFS